MKLSNQSHSLIESALANAMSKFSFGNEQMVVTDIHIQAKQGSGEFCIFDDDDEMLSSAIIDEWTDYENDTFFEDVERILRAGISKMKELGSFDNLVILKPFSFVLVDEDKETVADLLLIDDDTIIVNDELLKGLDDELDAFLKDLLDK